MKTDQSWHLDKARGASRQADGLRRLVIDARESGTSTGRYIDKLVEHLHKITTPSSSSVLQNIRIVVLTRPQRMKFMKVVAPGFKIVESPYKEFSLAEQIGLLGQLNELKPDLVHFGMTQQPAYYRGKTVTTIHDLTTAHFNNPAKNPAVFKTKQIAYRWLIKRVAKKSERLIVPSKFVKADVAQYTKIDPAKIKVIYEAADKITAASKPLTKLNGKKFIFYVGRANPHKNLSRLVEAFAKVRLDHPELLLVLVGKPDRNFQLLQKYVSQKNLTSQVLFTGSVSDGQLRWLYENAAAYVFPSLSEGFGLPGLEAMAHGTPVVASNAACLPEIYGDGAHYFNPLDTRDMAAKISQVLDNFSLSTNLIARGKKQAAKYSWDKMAKQTLEVYKSAID